MPGQLWWPPWGPAGSAAVFQFVPTPTAPPPALIPTPTRPGLFPHPGEPGYDPSAPGGLPDLPPRLTPLPNRPALPPLPGIRPPGQPGLFPDPNYPPPVVRVPETPIVPWQPGEPLPGGARPKGVPGLVPAPRGGLYPVLPKSPPAPGTSTNLDNCKRLQDQLNNRVDQIRDQQATNYNGFRDLFSRASDAFYTPGMTPACMAELDNLLKSLDEIMKDLISDANELTKLQRALNSVDCLQLVTADGSASDTAWAAHTELKKLDDLGKSYSGGRDAARGALKDILARCLPGRRPRKPPPHVTDS